MGTSAAWTETQPCASSPLSIGSRKRVWGDVKSLQGGTSELRLRVGAYRVRFTDEGNTLHVIRVLHRKEAYR